MNPPGPATMRAPARIWAAVRDALPQGQTLPEAAWARRHHAMLCVLWAHVALLPLFALYRGYDPRAAIGSVLPTALAWVAGRPEGAPPRAPSPASPAR